MHTHIRPHVRLIQPTPARLAARSFRRHARRVLIISLVAAAALVFAPRARAIEIQVEVLFDSLAQPPAPLSNVCTLRKAVNNANDNGVAASYPQCQAGDIGNDTIVFNVSGTITFALAGINEDGGEAGDLDITDDLTIIGHPDGTTIDAADLDRIFDIHPGVVVTLRNIHITNGTGLGGGGAIWIRGATLNLENCTVSNSFASGGDGGAVIMTDNAVLNMTNSTVTGNVAAHHAGAIVVDSGSAVLNMTNSTVTGNSSQTGLSGGLRNIGTANLRSSIISGNTNASMVGAIPNLDGTYISLGYNVIGELGTQVGNPTIIPAPGIADQLDVSHAIIQLGPLASNGGPTPTHALLPGSVAIDQGHSSGSAADQRGLTRPCDDAGITNATGGDGADSGAFEVQTVCASGSAPDAVDDAATVSEDSGANNIDVLSNDADADADALSVSAVTQGTHGAVAITGGGTGVSYTPALNYSGPDSFTYTVSDGNGGADTATVSVNVTPVQDAPVAGDDAASVAEDSAANTINVLVNDFDADGDLLVVAGVTQGTNGTVANNGANVSYTPDANFFGADTFTYTVSDGQGGFDTATVNVTVTSVNDAPVAVDDSYSMGQDTTLDTPAPGVLANDTDVEVTPLTAVLVTSTSNGLLVFNPDGSFMYTPNPGFLGVDTFTYKADDGTDESDVSTVTITVADTQGPTLTSTLAQTSFWPPSYNLVNVGLTVNATDNSGDPVTTQVFVFSDEDDLMPDAPEFSPDARDIAPGTLRLRSERSGSGDGRVYLVVVVATDSSNNVSRNCLTAVVPHSISKADKDAVAQQAQAALTQCATTGAAPAGYYVVGDGPVVGPKQ